MVKCKWIAKSNRIVFSIAIFLIPIHNVFALEENEKLWTAVSLQKPLSQDQQWLYSLYSQFRFINKGHPWQSTLLNGGIGYALSPRQSVWFGYQWSAHNPNNGFYQTNQLWQQLMWKLAESCNDKIILRTRLLEMKRSDEGQLAYVLRERLSSEYLQYYFGYLNPFIYDEVFFQLNATNYTSHQFVSQNRLFLGFNLYSSPKTFWEIGYINQYQASTPQNNQNKMSHVMSFTYNFA